MGLDDTLKEQIRQRAPELKRKLVEEFDELTEDDVKDTDDPDEIVSRVQKKTGQPREQVEQRVQQAAQRA
jgi:predicted house-cleaning noncanonical NTP pyrophosphatase (MazG superfamily)